ncbi:raffinose/stachyose/melibiose transport system substrate-binding protein [Thermocatellispora tengchongensis]|uniref:Raffinose/stachyose/melibiose transport system substrate-binding protein n=1 Tax=Thermocatellispora tengchongensis TaxID=1073253 RepID=A0A840P2Q3_9ACTN|nr:extracellular solute-binding protein [Thermocatellispora tengchongensis]MBB5132203.1 raffinose/stachyose/melibiose transport system substrate-binding protein [Thermocatellispora tengchongensis]
MSRRSVVVFAAAALALAGCGGGGGGEEQASGGGNVTIEWWHIQNIEPMRPVWEAMAKEYMAAHPNVKINIQPIENEAFKAKLTTVTQSGKAPDIFQTWGGGVLAQQVEAGLVKDITQDISSWSGNFLPIAAQPYQIDGKTYGIPYDTGMVGFWYNKKLFADAGIEQPPATWSELIDAVKKLKEAGITPIALAGKAKWPGHYWWTYLAMRIGGLQSIQQAAESKNWDTPDFVAAGQKLKELVDLKPFQQGFLGADYQTPDGQAATMGNGKAAMELMGQWSPTVQKDTSKDLGDDLGFFPFPTVEGGKGAITEVMGGGGGFAVGADAPAEAVDFLKYISTPENAGRAVATGAFQPVVKGIEDKVTDQHAKLVTENLGKATGAQLYLDQYLPPAVGQQINDSTAELIAGTKTPEEVAKTITQTAQSE